VENVKIISKYCETRFFVKKNEREINQISIESIERSRLLFLQKFTTSKK
jgi:tryptophanase